MNIILQKLLSVCLIAATCGIPLSGAEMMDLRISDNGRFLVRGDSAPFFPLADTAWEIPWRLDREETARYLRRRRAQKFNTVAIVAFSGEKGGGPNRYGDHPFAQNNNRYDPLRPLVTPGSHPDRPDEYDYWDHLEYIIDSAAAADMLVILLPAWGNCVAGDYGNGAPSAEILFDADGARRYGHWIGNRFRNKSNLIWMLGGDRSAVYGRRDYRPVFRAMAAGVAAGVAGNGRGAAGRARLMSYHPRKWQPNSSAWFHADPWLSFHSIQDQPTDQIPAIEHDWALRPPKPTWLFEGGYEHRRKDIYGPWQIRYQSYLTVFAGGFGVTYGNMHIYYFPRAANDLKGDDEDAGGTANNWEAALDDPGGEQMGHLVSLMASLTDTQFLDRIPDQELIAGDAGGVRNGEGIRSDRLQATRGARGDYAMIYSANGRDIRIRMDRLAAPAMDAYWFDPRTGNWRTGKRLAADPAPFQQRVPSGPGTPARVFDPPGKPADGNDWVLVLRAANGSK
jgi:hypothetical protein